MQVGRLFTDLILALGLTVPLVSSGLFSRKDSWFLIGFLLLVLLQLLRFKFEPLITRNEELQKTLSDMQAKLQKDERRVGLDNKRWGDEKKKLEKRWGDEKKKLELKVDEMAASGRANVAKEMQYLRSEKEKEELRRQLELQQKKTEAAEKRNVVNFKSQATAEKLLKIKEGETVELMRRMNALD